MADVKPMSLLDFKRNLEELYEENNEIDDIEESVDRTVSALSKAREKFSTQLTSETMQLFWGIAFDKINREFEENGSEKVDVIENIPKIVASVQKEVESIQTQTTNQNEAVELNTDNNQTQEDIKKAEFKEFISSIDFSKPIEPETYVKIAENYSDFKETATEEEYRGYLKTTLEGLEPEGASLLETLMVAEFSQKKEDPEKKIIVVKKPAGVSEETAQVYMNIFPLEKAYDNNEEVLIFKSGSLNGFEINVTQVKLKQLRKIMDIVNSKADDGSLVDMDLDELYAQMDLFPEQIAFLDGLPNFNSKMFFYNNVMSALKIFDKSKPGISELIERVQAAHDEERTNPESLAKEYFNKSKIIEKIRAKMDSFSGLTIEEVLKNQYIIPTQDTYFVKSLGETYDTFISKQIINILESKPKLSSDEKVLIDGAYDLLQREESRLKANENVYNKAPQVEVELSQTNVVMFNQDTNFDDMFGYQMQEYATEETIDKEYDKMRSDKKIDFEDYQIKDTIENAESIESGINAETIDSTTIDEKTDSMDIQEMNPESPEQIQEEEKQYEETPDTIAEDMPEKAEESERQELQDYEQEVQENPLKKFFTRIYNAVTRRNNPALNPAQKQQEAAVKPKEFDAEEQKYGFDDLGTVPIGKIIQSQLLRVATGVKKMVESNKPDKEDKGTVNKYMQIPNTMGQYEANISQEEQANAVKNIIPQNVKNAGEKARSNDGGPSIGE